MLSKHNASNVSFDKKLNNGLHLRMLLERASYENMWIELNKINITNFYDETSPKFAVSQCMLNNIDCRRNWRFEQTYLGIVLYYKSCIQGKLRLSLNIFKIVYVRCCI